MNQVRKLQTSRIRPAVDDDIPKIHAWLMEQERHEVPGTFLCNWSLTEKHHAKGQLLVYELAGEPVAYQWGKLLYSGILEVRADQRGKGIGKQMVEHLIAAADETREPVLYIQCEPKTSIPFWQRMGFQMLPEVQGRVYAYQELSRRLTLPEEGKPMKVQVQFLSEAARWTPGIPPRKDVTTAAVQTADGNVYLSERICCFKNPFEMRDLMVRLVVDGAECYFDKAKYEEAKTAGVIRCTNGYFVECIPWM